MIIPSSTYLPPYQLLFPFLKPILFSIILFLDISISSNSITSGFKKIVSLIKLVVIFNVLYPRQEM